SGCSHSRANLAPAPPSDAPAPVSSRVTKRPSSVGCHGDSVQRTVAPMGNTVLRTGTMVRARGLTRTFTRKKQVVEAVKGIDLDVAEGELVAFLGPNGAGKSTTLRMLTSLLAPTAGTAEVAGHDVVREPAQ